MALPATISTRPIFGTFFKADGSPASGATLVCTQAPTRVDDPTGGNMVFSTSYAITTNASGYASGSFIAADDVDISPENWTYSVAVSGGGLPDNTFHILVHESLPASGASFPSIMTDPASGDYSGGGAEYLNDLLDVSTSGAVSGNALIFNGTSWAPGAVSASGSFVTNSQLTTTLAAYVTTGDSRLADARTPLAHAASHQASGSDPIGAVMALNLNGVHTSPDASGSISLTASGIGALDQVTADSRYVQDLLGNYAKLLATAELVIQRDENAGTYALRNITPASSTRTVVWRGKVAPAFGGGYAISGVDIWEQTF